MTAKLSIITDPLALVVEVRDAGYKRLDLGLSPREIRSIDKGQYFISATLRDGRVLEEVVNIDADKNYGVKLSIPKKPKSKPLLSEIASNAWEAVKGRLTNIEALPSGPHIPSANQADVIHECKGAPNLPIAVRLLHLEAWEGKAKPARGVQISGSYGANGATINWKLAERVVLFAQVTAPGLVPVNVAVPAYGGKTAGCQLQVHAHQHELRVRVEFTNALATQCARSIERGDFDTARHLVPTSNPSDTSPLESFLRLIVARSNDPIPVFLGRYASLRFGSLDWVNNLPQGLIDVFDWMGDGKIISGELAARNGQHQKALNFMLAALDIKKHAPPLFTEGYKLLISRLRQYGRKQERAGILPGEEARKARRHLDMLDRYTAFMDIDPITLTFTGANLSDLASSQHPNYPPTGEGFFHLKPPAEELAGSQA